jgi:hypothetical protein
MRTVVVGVAGIGFENGIGDAIFNRKCWISLKIAPEPKFIRSVCKIIL